MLKYLIIQLDDTSVSYCHYKNDKTERNLIDIKDLKSGILYAMKENLTIQFLYPDYVLPKEYKGIINSIDHSNIISSLCDDKNLLKEANVIVFHDWTGLDLFNFSQQQICVLCTTKTDLFDRYLFLKKVLATVSRLNVVITDIESFNESDYIKYKEILNHLSEEVAKLYENGHAPQFNLLTDRILLNHMNNCNAGVENITLAPDGKFYACPAFYLVADDENYGLGKAKYNIGDLQNGVKIKNPQLYKLSHAPICRNCDAYQCKRCIWLNRKMTYEINTPSHEQCVIAHIERNASRELLNRIRKHEKILSRQKIKEIDYLDPFEIRDRW